MLRQRNDPYARLGEQLDNAAKDRKSRVEQYGKISDKIFAYLPRLEDCRPGVAPKEYNVIVAPPVFPEKDGNSSILIPEEVREKMEMAMQIVRIVATSPLAFNYDQYPPNAKPCVGDAVWIARYAGGEFEGKDGRVYRIIKDKDVGAVIEPHKVFEFEPSV